MPYSRQASLIDMIVSAINLSWWQTTESNLFPPSGGRNSTRLHVGHSLKGCAMRSFTPTNQCWMTHLSAPGNQLRNTDAGASKIYQIGSDMGAFEYRHSTTPRQIGV
jgi:hypothetical protein